MEVELVDWKWRVGEKGEMEDHFRNLESSVVS